jgi:hypothetical protein
MRRFSRAIVIPVAALTILVTSALPASADSSDTSGSSGYTPKTTVVTPVGKIVKPIVRTLGMNW